MREKPKIAKPKNFIQNPIPFITKEHAMKNEKKHNRKQVTMQ